MQDWDEYSARGYAGAYIRIPQTQHTCDKMKHTGGYCDERREPAARGDERMQAWLPEASFDGAARRGQLSWEQRELLHLAAPSRRRALLSYGELS